MNEIETKLEQCKKDIQLLETEKKLLEEKLEQSRIKKDYLKGQENCGIKVGDSVKVLGKANSYENGWQNSWVSPMNDYVGEIHKITEIKSNGVRLKNKGDCIDGWLFPYFVLEKVEETYKVGNWFRACGFLSELVLIDSKENLVGLVRHNRNCCNAEFWCSPRKVKDRKKIPFSIVKQMATGIKLTPTKVVIAEVED